VSESFSGEAQSSRFALGLLSRLSTKYPLVPLRGFRRCATPPIRRQSQPVLLLTGLEVSKSQTAGTWTGLRRKAHMIGDRAAYKLGTADESPNHPPSFSGAGFGNRPPHVSFRYTTLLIAPTALHRYIGTRMWVLCMPCFRRHPPDPHDVWSPFSLWGRKAPSRVKVERLRAAKGRSTGFKFNIDASISLRRRYT
jgi:hypothetical protein